MNHYTLIPTHKITERLLFENTWWKEKHVSMFYDSMRRRLYFELFFPFVAETRVRRAVVLMGPRRVGKTVMLFHSIERLLEQGISPQKIFFIGMDNPVYVNLSLEDLLGYCKQSVSLESLDGCYVFFDEIQYLKDWERHLKVLVDSYPNTKFVASGSAAAALRWHSTESGAGRFTDFMLPPLTFQEFIHLKEMSHIIRDPSATYGGVNPDLKLTHDIKTLNQEFMQYLNFGGYPEVVLSDYIQSERRRYIKSDIVDKVLLRDLPSLYGIRDVQELNRFFTYIAYNTGKEFSYEAMSKQSGIQKETLKRYLEYLEAAFLIKVMNKVDLNARHLKRVTSFKVYLTNPSLRTALFSPVSETDEEMGNMVETALVSQWMHREKLNLSYAHWREGRSEGEVDMVVVDDARFAPLWVAEVKWSNRYAVHTKELKSLIQFCKHHKLSRALVTTIDVSLVKTIEGIDLTFIPASVYAYNIGNTTLRIKHDRESEVC